MSLWQDMVDQTWWTCGRPVWVCDLKHGIMEIAEGAARGMLTGAVIGLVFTLLLNLVNGG